MNEERVNPKLLAQYAQQMMMEQDNMIKFQLDASREIETLRLDLLGKEYDDEGNIIDSDNKMRMINDKGANALLGFLRQRVTKMISLSNLDNFDIDKRCRQFIDDTTYMLGRHYKEFEIPSYQIMDNIIDLCDDLFFTSMKRAEGAGERDTLRKQYTHVESQERIQDNREQKPKLPFNFSLGGRGG